MKTNELSSYASIPMEFVGPLQITGPLLEESLTVPLATYETPLWPSTNRGARVSVLSGGIHAELIDERMSRSVLVRAESAAGAALVRRQLLQRIDAVREVAENTSRFAVFSDLNFQVVGNLLYIRLEMKTADAAGHNMVTKAADAVLSWILEQFPELDYVSVSGNFCTDKKVSAVNGILGRGKNIIADAVIPEKIVRRYLKSTPEKIVDLNINKNMLGSIVAGGLRTANAHFANMLLAFYLATGQDAANIIEGSQGFVTTEVRGDDLYVAVTLPNLIVGTVGAGKGLEFVRENLRHLGCLQDREPGANARRLAAIAAATVWCGEISLLAALTNPGELMQAHQALER